MTLDVSGSIYCVGKTYSFGTGAYDLALVKFYPNGTLAWNTTWVGSSNDHGVELALNAEGSVYCVSYTDSFGAGNNDLASIKFALIINPPVLYQIVPNPNSNGIIYLNWSSVVYATWYYVFRDVSPISSVENLIPIAKVSDQNYTDSISINEIYYYAIVAGNKYLNSTISNCDTLLGLLSTIILLRRKIEH